MQIANNDPDWRGDFKGLIEKLDYIKALGFSAIWITPVVQNASGTDFHGYHAMDMSTVDVRYESRTEWGSEEDVTFQSLIDAAHAKGMKIILDIVLNHTGNFGEAALNPLFTRSQNIKDQASVSASIIPQLRPLAVGLQRSNIRSDSSISIILNTTYITIITTMEQAGTGTIQAAGGDRLPETAWISIPRTIP